MTDDTGCPVPCPECGSQTVKVFKMNTIGTRFLLHEPNCPIADLQDVAKEPTP